MFGNRHILYLLLNLFNKFNNTGARMLDSIYHMKIKLLKNLFIWHDKVKMLPSLTEHHNGSHYATLRNL